MAKAKVRIWEDDTYYAMHTLGIKELTASYSYFNNVIRSSTFM
jgi:hypothetical protein